MADLVTLEEVNNALRLDLQLDDPSLVDAGEQQRIDDIEAKITQASDIVLDYVTDAEKDYWTDADAPDRVKAATIMVVRCLLDDTDESMALLAGFRSGTVDNPIVGLLYRLRQPTLA